MDTLVGKRLPAVKSLSSMLPAGTEGGKEFSRIIGLLLFNDAKKSGSDFSLFDDASGDFEGLDGYSRNKRTKDAIGYQYKFFPCPLSDAHRAEITKSLKHALERTEKLNLKKWIIVTPDDFKNSGRRSNGGDVSWFEDLRSKFSEIEIEHYGHSKILSLFLQAHFLCLYYYPSLVSSGTSQQKSIHLNRIQYDDNMRRKYGRIEFVGMSVYKEEASRRIPLEDIYIPLSVVQERSADESEGTPRIDPYTFLKPGAKNIILGDPGSGKSTLLGFLALAGINKELQARCKTIEDNRLTIFITLRRYADELKSKRNLPILDYILDVAKADFNMNGLDPSFFSYYIESGQAILLFDGLDELPSRDFKSLIRQRIDSFGQSFPNNTILVTSRLVGYEAESRFDDSYGHYRVAKLKVSEIQKFINDWYAARIDDQVERCRNAADLIKIITHPDSDSIRELARNPLLLTIVALVHRIDAVLPDQRVVLYQKCTETLLNTWYKSKRLDDETGKGRIERRNRLRVEAIAYWMHRRSLKGKARSVAPRTELIDFLTAYINKNETVRAQDDLAEDQAESFVDFIKNSAGLLIEAGDGLYSFIHLTFQEYLCATHLAAFGETGGTASIWKELRGDLQNPRWREVVRLLVASLRSTQAQSYFVDRLLESSDIKITRDNCLLLLGLLRDAIEPAENQTEEIITTCIEALHQIEDRDDAGAIIYSLLHWLVKQDGNVETFAKTWKNTYLNSAAKYRLNLLLVNIALVTPVGSVEYSNLPSPIASREKDIANFLILKNTSPTTYEVSEKIYNLSLYLALRSPSTNVGAAIMMASAIALDPKAAASRLFFKELSLLSNIGSGPHGDNGMNILGIAASSANDIAPEMMIALGNHLKRERYAMRNSQALSKCIAEFASTHSDTYAKLTSAQLHRGTQFRDNAISLGISEQMLEQQRLNDNSSDLKLMHAEYHRQYRESPKLFWSLLLESDIFNKNFLRHFEHCTNLDMQGVWYEALHAGLSDLPDSISAYFSTEAIKKTQHSVLHGEPTQEEQYFSAWIILFDIWTWTGRGYNQSNESPVAAFISKLRSSAAYDQPVIKLAILIHDVVTNPTEEGHSALVEYWASSDEIQQLLVAAGWLNLNKKHQSTQKRKSKTGGGARKVREPMKVNEIHS